MNRNNVYLKLVMQPIQLPRIQKSNNVDVVYSENMCVAIPRQRHIQCQINILIAQGDSY